MKKVSVIIPSYNVGSFIERCIDSVIKQSLSDIEIICVDAGSNDGTIQVIMDKAKIDERIRVVHSDVKSYGYQVNLGLSLSKGEYIGIVESDDYIDKNMYETLFGLAKDNDADIVKADYNRIIDVDGEELSTGISIFDNRNYYGKVIKPDGMEGEMIFSRDCNIWSGIYKREFLVKNNILCNETPGAAFQDIGFVLQTLCTTSRIVYHNVPKYQYRYMREGASTLNPNVLKFVYQETKYILQNVRIRKNTRFPLVMKRLCDIFMHEYGRMASKLGYESDCVKKYHNKLRDIFREYSIDQPAFTLLLNKPKVVATLQTRIDQCNEQFENKFLNKYRGKDIVIIGYGQRGKKLRNFCNMLGLKVKAVGDNRPSGEADYPDVCVKKYPSAYYLIASKFSARELYFQLTKLGISENKIEVYNPMVKIINYGAGKIGSRCEKFFTRHNIAPICFLDASTQKEGTFVGNVPVLKAEDIFALGTSPLLKGSVFFISTALGSDEIKKHMVSAGIAPHDIYAYDKQQELISFIMKNLVPYVRDNRKKGDGKWENVFFDLGNGVVLGGVESWSIDMGNFLKNKGMNVHYIAPCYETDIYRLSPKDVIGIVGKSDFYMLEYCLKVSNMFAKKDKFVYICNFYNIILDLLVWLKRNWQMDIKIIAVVHNDMDGYYDSYSKYIDEIDQILYMSQRQKYILNNRYLLPNDKLTFLGWQIPCKQVLDRTWSSEKNVLKIGYAGRLEKIQKRSDLLLSLIMSLLKKRIDIRFTIAGDGTYRKSMEEELKKQGLDGKVDFLGQLPKEKMLSFWETQDVMVSCSDWEGNSISKSEAMAAGTVPVVTNTSGALDDIDDGENGYVVPVGDIKKMVEVVEEIYWHRDLLPRLGMAAHKRIVRNNGKINLRDFWNGILDCDIK